MVGSQLPNYRPTFAQPLGGSEPVYYRYTFGLLFATAVARAERGSRDSLRLREEGSRARLP